MKIFAFTGNYGSQDSEIHWFSLPDSSVAKEGNPVFVPDFDPEFRLLPTLYFRIGRLGKGMAARFAARYIDGWGLGACSAGIGTLDSLRKEGAPWSEALAFDKSCLLGNLQPVESLDNYECFTFTCGTNDAVYRPGMIREPVDMLIERLGRTHTLKNGDIVLAAIMPEGLPMIPGTRLQGFGCPATKHSDKEFKNEPTKLIDFKIR